MPDNARLQIGLDCDGVLYPFNEYYIDRVEKLAHLFESTIGTQIQNMRNSDKWAFYEDAGWGDKQFFSVYEKMIKTSDFLRSPYDGVHEFIDNLWEVGDVNLYTSRVCDWAEPSLRQDVFAQTHLWAVTHELTFRTIAITPNKTISELDIILDDNLEACRRYLANGTMLPVLYTRQWNETCDYPIRVSTYQEYVDICAEAATYRDPFWDYLEPRIVKASDYFRNK